MYTEPRNQTILNSEVIQSNIDINSRFQSMSILSARGELFMVSVPLEGASEHELSSVFASRKA